MKELKADCTTHFLIDSQLNSLVGIETKAGGIVLFRDEPGYR